MMTPTPIGVVGFSGYSGAELLRLLRAHPHVTPILLEREGAAEGRTRSAQALPLDGTEGVARRPLEAASLQDAGIEVVMLATPVEASMALVPMVLAAGKRVIDLSGAFRLTTADAFSRWYGGEHAHPGLLAEAVYGMAELNGAAVREARLVANPGCYATAANLVLAPLVSADVIDRNAAVVCDGKSGVTGAGKGATAKTHFCAVADNLSAYGFFGHRHVGEILQCTGLQDHEFSFMTQLLPVRRGILASIYWRTRRSMQWSELASLYHAAYGENGLVRLYPQGQFPDLHAVVGSNSCYLGIEVDPATRRVLVVATIDNLLKGAASQAVQNLNLMLGLSDSAGLS